MVGRVQTLDNGRTVLICMFERCRMIRLSKDYLEITMINLPDRLLLSAVPHVSQ